MTTKAIAEPILDTAAAKTIQKGVKSVTATSTTARYSEYKPKIIRDAERLEREQEALLEDPMSLKKIGPMSANPDAGEAVTLHQKVLPTL